MSLHLPDADQFVDQPSPVRGVTRNVYLLSLVSLCTDISSEMVYPLIPLFLTGVLHAPAAAVGVIEGSAEATANVLKLVSGRVTDRFARHKAWIFAGYGLSTLAKPLMALATSWGFVLGVRIVDRTGKGIRDTPRDALLAVSTTQATRGGAFGFHRSMDTWGATVGPLVGLGLLTWSSQNFRLVFVWAGVPALIGLSVISRIREPARRLAAFTGEQKTLPFRLRGAPRAYLIFLTVSFVFALGNSSDGFLILRAHNLGLNTPTTVLAYAFFNLFYALGSWPAGMVSDRVGRPVILAVGFGLFAIVYGGLGAATNGAEVWPLFAVYGLFMALTDGVSKAYISDLIPAVQRGGALGLFTAATGLMALVAGVLAGLLWDHISPAAPMYLGAVTALCALGAFILLSASFERR